MEQLRKTSDYFFDLPPERIAQHPLEPRDHSRLLLMDRQSGELQDKNFYDIVDLLDEGDTLILNDSRVLPARIYGTRQISGSSVELLLLHTSGDDVWEVLAGPGRHAKVGDTLLFGDGKLTAEVLDIVNEGNRLVKFRYEGNFYQVLEEIGQMPLPPYITEKLENQERYQTVYSREVGSAAAPTAGLHFTPELLEKIKNKGVNIGFVTLHVGLGTFRPVKVDNITDHKMHAEHYALSEETATLINRTKAAGKRVIAVGTTSCRTLESIGMQEGIIHAQEGWTEIFIYPGYSFQVLDGLITNFHLPESTLIMLVSAFAGYEKTMNAYRHAVEDEYRFFSFGDAMAIL
ncbi:MAG: tRNA preQ1(34) S-adenosylmethionine ribosyltransferase-isomerase QueA [Clostridia bacterium]|nr:tRNA preQ1(34) S-adenosylmethionine ribosyltransferase-isomerase QueA [Clostridia bacterium]